MATAKHSGYAAAATAVTWTANGLNSTLADNEWTDLSDEIDNSTDLNLFADLELVLASAAFTGTDSGIEIYLVPAVDGTNYPNWTGNVTTTEQENNQHFIGFMSTSGATEAQRLALRAVALPPGKFKFACRNRSGVALAASGNTLSYRPWNYASTT